MRRKTISRTRPEPASPLTVPPTVKLGLGAKSSSAYACVTATAPSTVSPNVPVPVVPATVSSPRVYGPGTPPRKIDDAEKVKFSRERPAGRPAENEPVSSSLPSSARSRASASTSEVRSVDSPVEEQRPGERRGYTRDQWLALLPTTGGLTRLRPDQLADILDEVGTAIDALGGAFTMPYTTLATTAARVSAS